jgi:hypothetical protein
MRVLRWALTALFGAALALGLSSSALATMPTGSAYIAGTGGTCGATSLATSSCRLANVTCKNLWDPDGKRSFSIDDRTASLKVTEPPSTDNGTVIIQIGGGGTGTGEANTYGTAAFTTLNNLGLRIVQVAWAGGGVDNGMWQGSPSSSSYGGDSSPDGPLDLSCRFATLSKTVCEDSTLHASGKPCIAYGQSGGSSAIAYTLARYGGGDWLDGAVLSGGPPIGDLKRGCAATRVLNWVSTDCPPLKAVSPAGICAYTNSAVSGQFVDATWNDGRTRCGDQVETSATGSQGFGYAGIHGGDARKRFPYTVIRALYGDADSSEAVTLGRYVLNQWRDASGSAPVQIITTGSAPHAVLDATDGRDGVAALAGGGTWHAVTYPAITVTRPSNSSTWTPESIPGVELWISSHRTPHLWVEDYASQPLTHPAADGDAVRVIDDPVNGYIAAGATTSGLTLATSGGAPYLSFVRADSDYLNVVSSATSLDWLHKTGVGTILFRMGFSGNDGVQQIVFDNANATSANSGLYINRSTGNKLVIQMMRSVGASFVFNCTSTANFNVSTGLVNGYIVFGGSAGAKLKIGSAAEETCAYSSAPSTASAAQVAWIGRGSGGGNPADLMLGDLVIVRHAVTKATLDQWMAWSPTRSSASMVRATSPDRGFYNFVSRDYRYDVTDNLYTDSTCSTRVTASGNSIACVRPTNDPDGHLGRNGTQSTAANTPTWRGASSGAQWDGTNDELTLTQTADPGALTWLLVGSNNDTTNGSHFFSAGGRILVTGSSYSGNSPAQSPSHANGAAYMTTHPGTGGTCLSDLLYPAAGAFNALEVRRDGANWTQGVLRLSSNAVSLANSCTASNSAQMHFTHHGTPAIANWDLDGYVRRAIEWHVSLTEAQLDPVRRFFCAKYGGC